MGWVKRKETTREIEAFVQLLAEEKFTFQKTISTIAYDHAIPGDLIINLDYTPLPYVSPRKYLFKVNGAKNLHDKRQITTTFAVRATWEFYPIKLIYTEKPRDVCLQNVSFPRSFHVRYTENYWWRLLSILKRSSCHIWIRPKKIWAILRCKCRWW